MQGEGEGEGEIRRPNWLRQFFRFKTHDYMRSVELNILTSWELFSLLLFLHSNLESTWCSLIRGTHRYQVVFKYT